MIDNIEEIFYPRAPNVCRRAYALWELLQDFKADCDGLDRSELSRRCVQLVAFVDHIQKQQPVADPEEIDVPEVVDPRAERIDRMRHVVFNHATPPPPPRRGHTKKPKEKRR